jgi:hypothetical protein
VVLPQEAEHTFRFAMSTYPISKPLMVGLDYAVTAMHGITVTYTFIKTRFNKNVKPLSPPTNTTGGVAGQGGLHGNPNPLSHPR